MSTPSCSQIDIYLTPLRRQQPVYLLEKHRDMP